MTLTLADANRVIAGAIEKANQIGAKMNIAVCDAGGRLLAFQRMDGAMWAGSFGSQGKAIASAAFGRPSGDLTPRADERIGSTSSDISRQMFRASRKRETKRSESSSPDGRRSAHMQSRKCARSSEKVVLR